MGLFDNKRKQKQQAEMIDQLAKAIVRENKNQTSATKKEKQVVWQCRYCGCKNTRWQSNGMPAPGLCGKNGLMTGPKGPHKWVKIMTK